MSSIRVPTDIFISKNIISLFGPKEWSHLKNKLIICQIALHLQSNLQASTEAHHHVRTSTRKDTVTRYYPIHSIEKSVLRDVSGTLEKISTVAHDIGFFTNSGISVHYKTDSSVSNFQQLIYLAVTEVLRLHPILFAVPITVNSEDSYWSRLPSIDLQKSISFAERCQPLVDTEGSDKELDTLLENQHNTSFKSGYGTLPVWRLIILQDHGLQHQFTACFIAHHTTCDGTSSQIFQNAFQKALCNISSSPIPLTVEHIILSNENDPIVPSLEELHPLPLPDSPPATDPTVYNKWAGAPIQLPCTTRYVSLLVKPELMDAFALECKKHKSTPTAAIPSVIAKLLYNNLPPTTEALSCVLPVSLRLDLPPKIVEGQMGDFIDAFKVQLLRSDLYTDSDASSKSMDIWKGARKTQAETRRYFSNTSPSGGPYTNVAYFKLIPDLTAAISGLVGTDRQESLEVSNLGTFTRPASFKAGQVPFWQAGKVTLSRSAYAAGAPLVVCVLKHDEGTGFGFTWIEGAVADTVVENIISELRLYFRSLKL